MKYVIISFLNICFLTSCQKDNPVTGNNNNNHDPNITSVQKRLVQSDNLFGVKLFQQIHQAEDADKNIFISPLSISMALGMTLNGAEGDTRSGMESALELNGLSQTDINQAYRNLIDLFAGLDPAVKMDIANSIWYRQDFTVLQSFIQTNQQYFDAEVKGLDFDDPTAKDIINQWVKDATQGKIDEIVDEISFDHVMFLINAIYFQGFWTHAFDPKLTIAGTFYRTNGSTVPADMMFHEDMPFFYYDAGDVEIAEFPYGNGLYSMVVLLPTPNSSIDDLIGNLTLQKWDNWLSQVDSNHNLQIYMPKYEMEYEIELKDVLSILGMDVAFSDFADFSGINDQLRLKIDKVKHKTYVKVDEEGTEAAAVTSVGIVVTSLPPALNINRPFVVGLRERETGSIIFLGKITDPS